MITGVRTPRARNSRSVCKPVHLRHFDIEGNGIERVLLDHGERDPSIGRNAGDFNVGIAFKRLPDDSPHDYRVVHDQHSIFHWISPMICNLSRMRPW